MYSSALHARPHPTHALIDLEAFRRNLSAVRSYVGERVGIMAVVKAEAYGHGMVAMARAAVDYNATMLAVARVFEAAQLRSAGIEAPVLVFEVVPQSHLQEAVRLGVELTVVSTESARRLSEAAAAAGTRVRIHVKVDTGMGRLGAGYGAAADEIAQIVQLPHLELNGVYSHFATSEEADQTFARQQLLRFNAVLEGLRQRKIDVPIRHMANSGAIINLPEAHFDMVRPGIMLYGYPPGKDMSMRHPLFPVMSLVSHVAFVKTVAPGTSVSYGRRYIAKEETVIATVPIGYADGYVRALMHKAEALIGGRRYPVVGTICMDQVMVDCGRESNVREGEKVTLIGRDGSQVITAWDIAAAIGTIPYEVTCGIAGRVERVYR